MSDGCISVVVPVYKVEPWLDDCVRSILAQTYQNFELILVDDGSPDRCPAICDAWTEKDDRIKVVHQENQGLSVARNVGVDRSSGEFITFVDPDDFVERDYLEHLLLLLEQNPTCGYSECSMMVWRDGRCLPYGNSHKIRLYAAKKAAEMVLVEKLRVSSCAKLFRRELVLKVRFPAGRLHEDAYTICEFLAGTSQVVFSERPLYVYRLRSDSTVTRAYDKRNVTQHLEAAEHLVHVALSIDENLRSGCDCFLAYARMRALKYMENVPESDFPFRQRLRTEALRYLLPVLLNRRSSLRAKVGLSVLVLGLRPYFLFWRIYSRLRLVGRRRA